MASNCGIHTQGDIGTKLVDVSSPQNTTNRKGKLVTILLFGNE